MIYILVWFILFVLELYLVVLFAGAVVESIKYGGNPFRRFVSALMYYLK